MGIRQERKEKRAKAEEEIKKAFQDSCDYIEKHPLRFGEKMRLTDLRNMVVDRIRPDTRWRYRDIIKYYFTKARNVVLEMERKKREGDNHGQET